MGLAAYVASENVVNGQVKVEPSCREAQEKFRSLVECTSDWIWQVDQNGVYTYVSPKITDILGYSPEEVLGKTPFDLMPKEEAERIGKAFIEIVRQQTPFHGLYNWNLHKNGSLVLLETSGVPIIGKNGCFEGYRGIDRDITERKKWEDALEDMNEKLRVIGGLTRHDVRNKLCVISGNTYLLKKKYADDPFIVEKVSLVEQAVREAVKIFDFAALYERVGAEELVDVNVEKVVDEAKELFTGLPFKVINDCSGLTVLADSLLWELIYNLIDNTRKYGQKTSTARIHCKETNGKLCLTYEDDGVGIPMENKARLFNQVFSTGGSTGLGLFLSKKIIDVYGWEIEEKGEPGRGACFVITIPLKNQKGQINYKIQPNICPCPV